MIKEEDDQALEGEFFGNVKKSLWSVRISLYLKK